MPLMTFTEGFAHNGTLAGFAHGLTHAGSSRTPHVCVVMPLTAATFGYTVTFDSVRATLGAAIATAANVNVFVKRCHTVEDISGTF